MPKICYINHRFREDTKVRIAQANLIIDEYLEAGYKLTLRQLYYQFVARDLLANHDRNYKKLGDAVSKGREAGLIDWNAIEDRTRNLQANSHWDHPTDIVQACANQFQIDKWEHQTHRVEVWIEKDALVGVIERVCQQNDVSYFSCRGYTSASEMWRAGRRLARYAAAGQKPVVLHLGDHDPSGIDMTHDIDERLALFGRTYEIKVNRIALNMDQIEELNPPPNPAKPSDGRYDKYVEEYGTQCWELDALDPRDMERLVEEHIRALREDDLWESACEAEREHREDLALVANDWETAVGNLRGTND